MSLLKKIHLPHLFFIFSLVFFAAVFYLERHFMTNFDENDHLAANFFMLRDRLIYKDFFSHHFPLPYYWSYLFTPFWSQNLPARTITFFRLSVLAMYLINYIIVYLSFKNKFTQYAISLWLILLSAFFSLYHGNLVLSETFTAIFISSVFWLTIPIILGWEKVTNLKLFLLILFSSAAFWTQPLLIILFFIPIFLSPKNWLKIIILSLVINLIPIVIFYFTGQLSEFWSEGILFNFFTYPKYFVDDLPSGNKLIGTLIYFLQNEFYFFTHFRTLTEISQFIFHISFYVLLLKIIKQKNRFYLIIFFLLFLVVRIREVKIIPGALFNFGIYPFLIIASASLVICLFTYLKNKKLIATVLYLLVLSICLLNSAPVIKQSLKTGYNYEVFWSYRQRTADIIDKLSRPNEPILVYPHDVDYYALSSRLPPDRFVYWFPWIDSVSRYHNERLSALKNVDIPVIYLGSLDYKKIPNFYSQYFPDLTKNYLPVVIDNKPSGIWLKRDYQFRLKSL